MAVVGTADRVGASKLRALFSSKRLSPAQRLIAHYLTEHPREAMFLSSTDLARETGVSQPSATRLAIALGFEGYAQLQEHIRSLLTAETRDAEGDRHRNKYQLAVDAEVRNLVALRAQLVNPKPLIDLGAALVGSMPLVVCGLRASAPLAAYFHFFASKIHPDVWLLTEGGSSAADRLAQARQLGGAWVLVFLLPRYPREAFEVLRMAVAEQIRVAVITDTAQPPIADVADVVLPAAVGSQMVFDSQTGPMLVATMLFEAMSDADPVRAQERLEDFERRVAKHKFFL